MDVSWGWVFDAARLSFSYGTSLRLSRSSRIGEITHFFCATVSEVGRAVSAVHHLMPDGERSGLYPRRHAQLVEDVAYMAVDGALADKQFVRQRLVGFSQGYVA